LQALNTQHVQAKKERKKEEEEEDNIMCGRINGPALDDNK
jgi:hypothetical protein